MLLGLALLLSGIALRVWALRHLTRYGGFRLEQIPFLLPPPKGIVTTGPYRWLKHPAYLGTVLMIAGVGALALGPAGAVLAVPAVPFYTERCTFENAALRPLRDGTRSGGPDGTRAGGPQRP